MQFHALRVGEACGRLIEIKMQAQQNKEQFQGGFSVPTLAVTGTKSRFFDSATLRSERGECGAPSKVNE
jgi:hypothetical protein